MCEVVFKERAGAENVIAMYHNNWVSFLVFRLLLGWCGRGWEGNAEMEMWWMRKEVTFG